MRQLSQVCRARRGAIGHRPYGQHIPRAGCQTAASGQDTALPFSCPAAVFLSGLLLFLLVDRVHVRERQRTPLTTRAIAPRIAPPSASNPPLLRCTSLDSSSELACIFCMHVRQSIYHGCLGVALSPLTIGNQMRLSGTFSWPDFSACPNLDFPACARAPIIWTSPYIWPCPNPIPKPNLIYQCANFRLLGVPKFGSWPYLRCFSSRRCCHRKFCAPHSVSG